MYMLLSILTIDGKALTKDCTPEIRSVVNQKLEAREKAIILIRYG